MAFGPFVRIERWCSLMSRYTIKRKMGGNVAYDFLRLYVPLFIGATLFAIYLGERMTGSSFTTLGIVGFVLFISILFWRLEIAILLLLVMRTGLDMFRDVNIPLLGSSGRLNPAAIIAFTISAFGICYILARRINIFKMPISCPYLLFLIIAFSTIIISPDKILSIREWSRFLSIYVLYILVAGTIKNDRDIKRVVQAIFISSIVPLAVGSYQIFAGGGQYDWMARVTRINATFASSNGYAAYLAMFLIVVIVFTLYSRSTLKSICFLLMAGVMLMNLYFTYTRAPIVGCIVAIIVVGALKNKKVWIALLFVAMLAYFLPTLLGRFNLLLSRSTYEAGSLAWRFRLWEMTIGLVKSSPLVGRGPATFSVEAHNDYLRFLVEYGAFGLIAIIWMIAVLFKEGLEVFKKSSSSFHQMIALSFIAVLASHTVMALGSNSSFRPVTSWYLFSLGAVVHRVLRNERSKKDRNRRKARILTN
ncbi:hypothetical protein ES703_49102 [subsurface metagenome]